MPNSYPCDAVFNPHLTTIKDSYKTSWWAKTQIDAKLQTQYQVKLRTLSFLIRNRISSSPIIFAPRKQATSPALYIYKITNTCMTLFKAQ